MSRAASALRSLPATLLAYAALVVATGALFPLAFLLEAIRGPAAWTRLLRAWARLALRLGPVRLRQVDETTPAGPGLFICNHQSSLDILILAAILPPPCLFVARAELFRRPVVGTVLTRGGHIPLMRGHRGDAARMAARAEAELRAGRSVVIFPEGRRSPTGELGPFRTGAFRIARRAQAPVIPVVLAGTRRILPPGSRSLRGGTVTAWIGRALPAPGAGGTPQRQAREASRHMARCLRDLAAADIPSVAGTRDIPEERVGA